MNAKEIFNARRKLGTMSRDYGKTIDDVLHIEDAKELDTIEESLTELLAIQIRAKEMLAKFPLTEPERKIIEYIINDTDSKTYERITKGIV